MGRITFNLNGSKVEVDASDELPLLYALRDELGLKATRFGCGDAACGACTVIVDGVARTSCDLPVSAVAGCRVETAEALDVDPAHPLLEAMLAHQAGQCGYCLSGIVMAAKAYLDAGGGDDRATIAQALDANLCRCGTHARILDAVEDAARRIAGGAA
ncbi:(2Fe-2S)-binding protein [Palleronia sp. KMU-117]|uniref:(2Fe-2S)-binding protein n=1 Tax=Palleronia sp. KMU-117 TaxID=3434108 RepID=UPI003D7491FE